MDAEGGARNIYALACATGVLGLALIAFARNALLASSGVLLVSAIAFSVTRTVGVIWVNRRTPSNARATMLSLLSRAETVGEIAAGFALALLADHASVPGTLAGAAGLVALAAVLVAAFGAATPTSARPEANGT